MLDRAELRRADCREAVLADATLTNTKLIECDLRGCDLRRVDHVLDLGTAYDAQFVGCDLRGAKLDGRRLRGTKLIRCRFNGVVGKPVIEGPIEIVDPDMSPAGDGSEIIAGTELERQWRA